MKTDNIKTITINHPANGRYATQYLYGLKNKSTGEEVVIFSSPRCTYSTLVEAIYDEDAKQFLLASGATEMVKRGNGRDAWIELAGSDWFAKRLGTKRDYHNKQIKAF